MTAGEPGADGAAGTQAKAQEEIRSWGTRSMARLRHMAPQAILAGMTVAAFTPVLVPLIQASDVAAAVQASLGQFGGAGAGYLAAIAQQFADRQREREAPPLTEQKLAELLGTKFEADLGSANSADAQAAIRDLVLGVSGIHVLLKTAAQGGQPGIVTHLVRALANDPSLLAAAVGALDSLRMPDTHRRPGQREDAELPGEVLREIRQLRYEITRPLPYAEGSDPGASPPADPCPYPGLAPFRKRDAAWFFGRSTLVVDLVEALDERVNGGLPLIVVGASGAGKSSVLLAGLIPALERGNLATPGSAAWPVRHIRPDVLPLEQLALHLAELSGHLSTEVSGQLRTDPARAALIVRQGLMSPEERHSAGIIPLEAAPEGIARRKTEQRRLVLIVDQFEEVFTRCRDEDERQLFIDALCAIASGTAGRPPAGLVAIGLQLGFMEQCIAHPALWAALDKKVTVGPMTAGDLEDAIVLPARKASLTVQAGLVHTMLEDLGAVRSPDSRGQRTYDAGRLPLLAHALFETWRARDGQELTVAAYRKAGGVGEALANTAEGLLGSLGEGERRTLRELLLYHLVAAPDLTEDARRHISRAALLNELPAADRETAGVMLGRLADARLLTEDGGGVQIAHEALLRHWPTLARWLADERDRRREAQRVFEQARRWDESGRSPDFLPVGNELAIIEEKLAGEQGKDTGELGGLAGEFLRAARDAERDRVRAEQEQAARDRNRRRRQVLGGIAAAIAVVTVLVTVLQVRANDNRNLALAQSRAETSQLIESAQNTNDPVRSLLLDVEAYRVGGAAAGKGLLSAQTSFFTSTLALPAGAGRAVAFDAAEPLLAVAGQEAITVFSTTTHQTAHILRGASPFYAVAFDKSGALLAGAEQDGSTVVWDTKSWRQILTLGAASGLSVNAVAFAPKGSRIATAGISGVVMLWDLHGRLVSKFEAGTMQDGVTINAIAFSPDGTRLAAACSDRTVRLWSLSGRPDLVELTGHSGPVRAVAFSPGSKLLVSGDDDGAIRLWDGHSGARLGTLPGSGTQQVDALAVNPQGTLLASGGGDGVVRLWDIDTRALAEALTGPSSRVTGLAFSHTGQAIASVEADSTVGLWNVVSPPQPGISSISAVATALGARQPVATIGSGKAIGLWSPVSTASYASATLPTSLAVNAAARGDIPPSVALSPDGTVMAAPLGNRVIALFSTNGGLEIGKRHAPQPLTSVAYSPAADGPVLAAGGSDGLVYLWAPGASQPMTVNGNLASAVTSVAFSPDGKLLAAGSADGIFLLAARGPAGQWTPLPQLTVPLDAINTVAFNASGTLLATGSASGTVRLWNVSDPADPTLVTSLSGPAGQVISVAFSGQGMLAAAADDDGIRVWNARDPARPALVGTFTGLAAPTSIAWEPGTETLVGAGPDGTLLTWDTDPGQVAERMCRALASHASELAPIVPGNGYPPVCP